MKHIYYRHVQMTFLVTVGMLFPFCNKSNDSARVATDEIWPLQINNEWNFTWTSYKEDGSIKETSTYTGKVTSDTIINGNKFFKLGELFLRNTDNNTVEVIGASNVALPYLKRSSTDNDKYYSHPETLSGCTASVDYITYTSTSHINGHACLKNEEIYKNCSGGIRVKIIKYFESGVGLVSVEKYSKKVVGSDLYLSTKEVLQSYKLN